MITSVSSSFLYLLIAILCAFCISVTLTPIVRVFAFRFKVTDVPKDNRRMHKKEMPLMGGLAIFLAFLIGTIVFCEIDKRIVGFLLGALLITVVGIIDDKCDLNPFIKLIFQIAAALMVVLSGIKIDMVNIFGDYLPFGNWSNVITIIWIIALTNAINLIDGLDGLSCGVSTISCFTLLVSVLHTNTPFVTILMIGILAGSCLGFLPFNFNPAKIFMGDTGSMFLGYSLSVLSILGCFKLNALVSFWVPFLIFALPLFDTAFAFVRRILTGRSPFSADRGHLHHRLIDRGFDQKHAVMILYAVSGMSGISAILISFGKYIGAITMLIISVAVLILNLTLVSEDRLRHAAEKAERKRKELEAKMAQNEGVVTDTLQDNFTEAKEQSENSNE